MPLYPAQMTSSPLNLHVHGLHVRPKGNADNVLLHIPAGMSNTYTYHIPNDMPQGAYWYHSHLHTLTTAQTYLGLAGLLAIGRVDGNLPIVTRNRIPIRNMILQYNDIFDRMDGLAQIINPNWPQFVNTLATPSGNQLANGTYRPSLAPVNFADSKKGTQYLTIWFAGPLAIGNERGRFQFIPSNLQRFTAASRQQGRERPGQSLAPRSSARRAIHRQRSVPAGHQEQGRSDRDLGARQCQRHRLHERRADRDGDRQSPEDRRSSAKTASRIRRCTIRCTITAPSSSSRRRRRYAIAVTMPAKGDLVLEMPPRGGGARSADRAGRPLHQ